MFRRARHSRPVSTVLARAAGCVCEALETRQLLSTINWVNQGSDNFGIYGANANVARQIVSRAIADWANIIENFNYAGGGNTFNLTINATAMPSATSRGDANIDAIDASGKPTAATVRMDDNGAGDNWYFDPNVGTYTNPDDAEFDTILSPFAADASVGPNDGYDFYRTILHEIGHGLGIATGAVIGGNALAIDSFLTDTGFDDPNTSETTNLWRFSRNGVVAGFTKHGGLHTYEGAIPSGLTNFASHPNDLLNAGRTVGGGVKRRQLITDTVANVLREAYGYTVLQPSTVNNFFVNANYTSRTLNISGQVGSVNDLVVVQGTGVAGQLHVTVGTVGGGATFTEIVPWPQIDRINVNAGDGNDIIRNEFNAGRPTTFNGGNGNDIFDFAFGTRNLDNIQGETTVTGAGGDDSIFIYDNNNFSGNESYTVSSNSLDRAFFGGVFYGTDTEGATLTTTPANDLTTVLSSSASTRLFFQSAGGQDTLNIGHGSLGAQDILGDIQVQNDPNFTVININDSPSSAPRNIGIDQVTGNWGVIGGLAPAFIIWDRADVQTVNINTGTGADTINLLRTSEAINFYNPGGRDVLTIGNDTNGVQSITGAINVGPNAGLVFTDIYVKNTADTVARSVTWLTDSAGFTISGIAPAGIRYDHQSVVNLNVLGGAGDDSYVLVAVPEDWANTNINGGGGFDTLRVDDRAMPVALDTVHVHPDSFYRLLGVAVGIRTNFFSIESPTLYLHGACTNINVYGTPDTIPLGSQMTIFGGPNSDTVRLYPRNVQGNLSINGTLGIFGGAGTNNLIVEDAGSSAPIGYQFINPSGPGTQNIYGMGAGALGVAGFAGITVNAGNGNDSFLVDQYRSGIPLAINGGGGDDGCFVGNGNLSTYITSIAAFNFDGGPGADTFQLSNQDNPNPWNYLRNAATVTASSTGYFVGFPQQNVESLLVKAGPASDSFNVEEVPTGTGLHVEAGGGWDSMLVARFNLVAYVATVNGPLVYNAGADGGQLRVLDELDTGAKTTHIDANGVGHWPGDNTFGADGSIRFSGLSDNGTTPGLQVVLGLGSDTIYAQPLADATVVLSGGAAGAASDELNLALAGVAGYVINSTGAGAGNVTSSNRKTLSWSSIELPIETDDVAPAVVEADINVNGIPGFADGAGNRQALEVQFSEDVSGLISPAWLELTNLTTNQTIPAGNITVEYDAATNTARFTFPGYADGILPDGNYSGRILAGLPDFFGNPLPADHVFDFFFLNGDANHDGRVNLSDFNVLAANFGQSGRTFSEGDFTYDGVVNLSDFNILASRFGTVLGAGGSLATTGEALPVWRGTSPFTANLADFNILAGRSGTVVSRVLFASVSEGFGTSPILD